MAPAGTPIYTFEQIVLIGGLILLGLIVLVVVGSLTLVWLHARARVRAQERYEDALVRIAGDEAQGRFDGREQARLAWLDTYLDYGRLPLPQVTAYYLFDQEHDVDAGRMIATGYDPIYSGWEQVDDGEQLRVVYRLDPGRFHQAAMRWREIRAWQQGRPLIPA